MPVDKGADRAWKERNEVGCLRVELALQLPSSGIALSQSRFDRKHAAWQGSQPKKKERKPGVYVCDLRHSPLPPRLRWAGPLFTGNMPLGKGVDQSWKERKTTGCVRVGFAPQPSYFGIALSQSLYTGNAAAAYRGTCPWQRRRSNLWERKRVFTFVICTTGLTPSIYIYRYLSISIDIYLYL